MALLVPDDSLLHFSMLENSFFLVKQDIFHQRTAPSNVVFNCAGAPLVSFKFTTRRLPSSGFARVGNKAKAMSKNTKISIKSNV